MNNICHTNPLPISLLSEKINIHHQSINQFDLNTQLYTACRNGQLSLMKQLILSNANPIPIPGQRTLLHIATKLNTTTNIQYNNVIEIMKYLIEDIGIDVNNAPGLYKFDTPLFTAIIYGNLPIIKILIENYNANIIIQYHKWYWTLFHCAIISNNSIPIMNYFIHNISINNVVDINQPDHYGQTPLLFAADKHKWYIVEYLLEQNELGHISIDKYITNHWNHSLYHYSLFSGDNNMNLIHMIYKYLGNININNIDNDNQTPMSYAAIKNRFDIVQQLILYNANPFIKGSKYQRNLLHLAAISLTSKRSILNHCGDNQDVNNNIHVVEYLIQNVHIELDDVDTNGYTALMIAIDYNNVNVIQQLLKFQPNPFILDHNYQSILHHLINSFMCDELIDDIMEYVIEYENEMK